MDPGPLGQAKIRDEKTMEGRMLQAKSFKKGTGVCVAKRISVGGDLPASQTVA